MRRGRDRGQRTGVPESGRAPRSAGGRARWRAEWRTAASCTAGGATEVVAGGRQLLQRDRAMYEFTHAVERRLGSCRIHGRPAMQSSQRTERRGLVPAAEQQDRDATTAQRRDLVDDLRDDLRTQPDRPSTGSRPTRATASSTTALADRSRCTSRRGRSRAVRSCLSSSPELLTSITSTGSGGRCARRPAPSTVRSSRRVQPGAGDRSRARTHDHHLHQACRHQDVTSTVLPGSRPAPASSCTAPSSSSARRSATCGRSRPASTLPTSSFS